MTNANTVKKKVAEVIQEVLGAETGLAGLDPKTPLKAVSAIDSLTALRIMVALENKFKLKFEASNLEETFHSVETLARYIEARIGQGAAR
ncbi:MAG: acyl carrier protein [Verrucomicrobiia bacterium]|jgi:acyl carrier protein